MKSVCLYNNITFTRVCPGKISTDESLPKGKGANFRVFWPFP